MPKNCRHLFCVGLSLRTLTKEKAALSGEEERVTEVESDPEKGFAQRSWIRTKGVHMKTEGEPGTNRKRHVTLSGQQGGYYRLCHCPLMPTGGGLGGQGPVKFPPIIQGIPTTQPIQSNLNQPIPSPNHLQSPPSGEEESRLTRVETQPC